MEITRPLLDQKNFIEGKSRYSFVVNETVYSYGRYNGSYSPSSGAYGPVGDGVLLKKDTQYALDRIG